PVQLLSDCAAALTGNGALVVVTPDRGSLTARVMGTRWWHFRLAHVGYFNRQSMRAAAVATGLTCATEFRARWFFDVRYIAERLATYLPIGWINRLAERPGVLRRLYDCVIPVNPHDSMVVLLKPTRNR
ncbi:MAG TPA: hypothetical protein VJZ25_06715, partial [Gemmatimonadaceae bacterium]|nr:hypothetical protein [Gemmatimonadaceae bacterium]